MDRGPSQGSLPRHVSAPHSHRLRASALHGPLASRAAPHNCQTCAPVMIFSATTPGFGHQLDIAFKIVPHALFVYLRNSIQLSIISRQFVGFRNPPDPILCVVRSPLPLLSGSGHNRFLQLSQYATVHLCFPLNACLQHNTLLPRLLSHTIFVFVGFSFTSSPRIPACLFRRRI